MARGQRITNGQRAAVAGLIIAGIGLRKACRIVDAPMMRMYDLLPARFCRITVPKRGGGTFFKGLTEADREEIRRLWPISTISQIASRYDVDYTVIKRAAVRLGLPPKRHRRRPKSPYGVRQMNRAQRSRYVHVRKAYGRAVALMAVFG